VSVPARPKKKPVGRKSYTEDWLKQNLPEIIQKHGGIIRGIADELAIDISTLWRYSQKYEWIDELRDKARITLVDEAESKLREAVARGESWAVQYMLSHQGGKRGYGNKLEIKGTINHVNITFEPPQEFIDITPTTYELEDKTDK
jgi:hypothetical protein